jgi:hypothetical protein
VLEIDVNEPHEITLLLQPIGDVNIKPAQPLNAQGYADYRWFKHDGKQVQVERKTWPELLANPDAVEEQLHRHLTKHSSVELVFMLEGVPVQADIGTNVLKPSKSGVWVKHGYRSSTRLKRVYSLLYRFSEYMRVVQTTSLVESGIMLCSMYESDQKAEHTTFNRHIKQVQFNTDNRVLTLMGSSPGLGDRRATDIIEHCGTPWNFFSAGWTNSPAIKDWREVTQLKGIGEPLIKSVLRNIGRPDV